MRQCKLKQGKEKIFEIEKKQFENLTNKAEPYYVYDENKKDFNQYAVCPVCDNPIQIIGLYKLPKNINHPYGKHYPKSIKDIATYNQQTYEFCPYRAKQNSVNKDSRRRQLTEFEKNVYNILREYFDTAIYIINKSLDIKITNRTARELLEKYIITRGYLYDFTSINNIPYMLLYLYPSLQLYGQLILKDSPLYKTIKKKCLNAEFIPSEHYEKYEILKNKNEHFLDISYCLMHHTRKVENDICVETIKLSVSTGCTAKDNLKTIYSKVIKIEENYFLNLIKNEEKNKKYRNQELLDIANEIMLPL